MMEKDRKRIRKSDSIVDLACVGSWQLRWRRERAGSSVEVRRWPFPALSFCAIGPLSLWLRCDTIWRCGAMCESEGEWSSEREEEKRTSCVSSFYSVLLSPNAVKLARLRRIDEESTAATGDATPRETERE